MFTPLSQEPGVFEFSYNDLEPEEDDDEGQPWVDTRSNDELIV